jgi:Acetyltransferase (GNAT) domain
MTVATLTTQHSKVQIARLNRNSERDLAMWSRLLRTADGATLFHTPEFLSYHGDRFDEHHLGVFKGDQLIALMPMALVSHDDGIMARSPYGASYGGMITAGQMSYRTSCDIALALSDYLSRSGVSALQMTPSLLEYSIRGDETLLFAMMQRELHSIRHDVTHLVPVPNTAIEESLSSRARRAIHRAEQCGVTVARRVPIAEVWPLIEMTHAAFGGTPTHTMSQLASLSLSLRHHIFADAAMQDGKPIAAVVYFVLNSHTWMTFYLATNPEYRDSQGLTLLLCDGLSQCARDGIRYLDLGTSSVDLMARDNLFQFKENFGTVARFRTTYLLDLKHSTIPHRMGVETR